MAKSEKYGICSFSFNILILLSKTSIYLLITIISSFTFRAHNVTDQIFSIVREMAPTKGLRSVKISEVMEQCVSKGFKPDQVDACIEEYEELNVWQTNQAHTKITFI